MYQRKAEHIRSKLTRSWREILNVGEDFILVCGDEDTLYLTHPEDAVKIWTKLASLTEGRDISFVVDGFAGVGDDTLAAMCVFKNVIAVQHASNARENMRFNCLKWNTFVMKYFFPGKFKAKCKKRSLSEFLRGMEQTSKHSLLYLDPPWLLSDGKYKNELQLLEFLRQECFEYHHVINPYLICIKLPPLVKEVHGWISGYDLIDTIEIRRKTGDVKFNVFVFKQN
jgi:16S rRNA G966 N2-methylase RsmD